MSTNQSCPPIPNLQQFAQLYHNGEYILVDVEDLKTGEYVLSRQPNWDYFICVQIGENNNEHIQFRFQHLINDGFISERKSYINSVRGTNRELLFFRKNFRKNFDKASAMIENRIHNNTIGNDVSDAKKNVLGNPDLYNLIGDNLAPRRGGKGGRKKRRGTRRRTRKNKRKVTRRIRGK